MLNANNFFWKTGRRSAFTLAECLIAASIAGVLGVCVLTTFSAGLRIYRSFDREALSESVVFLSLGQFGKDVRSAFVLRLVPFSGTDSGLSFPVLGEGGVPEKIVYFFDDRTGTLLRRQQTLRRDFSVDEQPQARALASCRRVSFEYYYPDPLTGNFAWQNSFSLAGALPRQVRIRFIVTQNGDAREYTKTLRIPSAG